MTFSESIINASLAMGLFAFYVVVVSLLRFLRDKEFFRLTAMKRVWGRRRGLALLFLTNVAVPLLFGIVFFTRGLIDHDPTDGAGQPVSAKLSIAAQQAAHSTPEEWYFLRNVPAATPSSDVPSVNLRWELLLP